MVEFRPLDDVQSGAFGQAMEVYTDSFPSSERHAISVIRDRVASHRAKLWVGLLDGSVVFISLLWPLSGTEFILLDYMAVKKGLRGKRIGSEFLAVKRDELERDSKYFVMEIEDPRFGSNRDQRNQRVAFYRRNGAKELKNVDYLLPPLSGTEPTNMILMLFPAYKERRISSATTKALVSQIYGELYGRGRSDSLLLKVLTSIVDPVELV
jgi:GNAT superfamily N-acetyltransferase